MFKEVLREIVDGAEGSLAGLVMGFDGIALDQYVRPDAQIAVENIGAEYSLVLKEIRKAAQMLDAGDAHEVAIRADKLTTIVRFLTPEYFAAVALVPEGNANKARYLLRTRSEKMSEALR